MHNNGIKEFVEGRLSLHPLRLNSLKKREQVEQPKASIAYVSTDGEAFVADDVVPGFSSTPVAYLSLSSGSVEHYGGQGLTTALFVVQHIYIHVIFYGCVTHEVLLCG